MSEYQVCMTGSRVIVEQGIYDRFCEKFAAKVATLKVGDPRDPEVLVGPLIRPTQAQFVKEQLDQARPLSKEHYCSLAATMWIASLIPLYRSRYVPY